MFMEIFLERKPSIAETTLFEDIAPNNEVVTRASAIKRLVNRDPYNGLWVV